MILRTRELFDVSQIMEMDLQQLLLLRAENLLTKLDPNTFDHIFKQCDALWQHSGNPNAPHAELTSGMCSDGFVNVLAVLKYTQLCEIMAAQIADRVIDFSHMGRQVLPEWIIGSDHAGATLSFEVARQLAVRHDFTEKGDSKSQVWNRFVIGSQERILQVEELVTTSLTLDEVRKGVRAGNPNGVTFMPYVMALVHRSSAVQFEGGDIHFVRHYDINTWDPADCPLCARGSKRLKPKANWRELTAEYT